MNKTNPLSKLFTLLIVFSISAASFAQEVDSIELNGERYYVYPFNIGVSTHSQYYSAMKGSNFSNDLSFLMYQSAVEAEMNETVTKKDYKRFKREMRRYSDYDMEGGRDEYKHLNNKFYKAVRKNPYPLLQQRFRENNDITPILDPIPDGNYVQFYDEFCLIDEKGRCIESEQRIVAGYFTMKNNVLEGEATWVDLQGDTLKHGWFVNGAKEGEWRFERRFVDYAIEEDQADLYIERGYLNMDTIVEFYTYRKGAQDGPYRKFENSVYATEEGEYTNGVASGTWTFRSPRYVWLENYDQVRDRNNELITSRYTYEDDESLVSNPIWIRKGLAQVYSIDMLQFSFYDTEYDLPVLPQNLYKIAFPDLEEEDLELEEETEGAPYDMDYSGEEMYYEEEMYYDEEYSDYESYGFGYDDYEAIQYDATDEKFKSRGVLLDSLGGKPKYSGTYEEFYPNGQLAFRYIFNDGVLVLEDTVFWENGIAHDVITTVPDSNQFLRSIYDSKGKLFEEIVYDSKGDFIRIQKSYQESEKFILDGLVAEKSRYGDFYLYDKSDTLGTSELTAAPLTLFRSWAEADSAMLYNFTYYPEERKLTSEGYSVTKKQLMFEERVYAENFESWTGKRFLRIANLELERTSSASHHEFYSVDSIPIRNVQDDQRFSMASQYELKKEGQLYTGPVDLSLNQKKFSLSKNNLKLILPSSKYTAKKLMKDLKRYRAKGKTKYPLEMGYLDATELRNDISISVYRDFFSPMLGGFFERNNNYYDDYDGRDVKKRDAAAKITTIEGYMLDGKPHGLWIGFDQFGEKIVEVPYTNGEASGEVIHYQYAKPLENENYMMEYNYENPLMDSFPEKKVHYVSRRSNYLNGQENGESISYSWYGDIISSENYVDGRLDGPSMERNKIATTFASYKYGAPDGYVRTYLTLNPKDSILLYNLNFQDGLLQGESKAFHTNGQLAKRGFFLDGRPIEDYEAFDSLGFKYHYVKFQYSFPIEEKIWEENQLSVRYLFSWEDSIYFEPRDITSSQSLDVVIAKLGLGGGYFEQPYYGRPSLVDKSEVNYHMTKYYPNDTISRDGDLEDGRKIGCWRYYSYNGELLYEVDYSDSIIEINDSIKFKSKGILTDFNENGDAQYEAYVIEMSSKYDCSHSDHYEVRQLYTRWEANDAVGRMNGYVQNFYDNGTIQSEGVMKNGLPDGVWKYYDPYGKLNQYGVYVLGKRDARWLSGDLSKTKYLGDICLNPNLPDLEDEIKYRENLLDIKITNYSLGKSLNTQYYDINMNQFLDAEEMEEDAETPPEEFEED